MKNVKKIIELYISDFTEIAETSKKLRVPNIKIEKLQETYLGFLIKKLFECVNIPKEKKLEIIKKLKAELCDTSQ